MQDQIAFLYQLNPKRIKLGLEATKLFLKKLNLDKPSSKIIHVAGTNGKGSTSIIMYELLCHLGFKTGLFTSPHILSFNERIRVNDRLISNHEIDSFILANKDYIIKNDLTFFEVNSVMAMHFFAKCNCDYIILETGMGGRLDSTNCFDSILTLITNVALDHQAYLGNTIEEIIYEKCGIIKDNTPLICAEQNDYNFSEIVKHSQKKKNVKIERVFTHSGYFEKDDLKSFRLKGLHQQLNAESAFKAIELVLNESMQKHKMILNKINWPGRLEFYDERLILDVSHNYEGLKNSINYLKENYSESSFSIICAFSEDKDISQIFDLLNQLSDEIYLYPLNHPRMNLKGLQNKLEQLELNYKLFTHQANLNDLKKKYSSDYILVIGSHFLLEDFHKSYL